MVASSSQAWGRQLRIWDAVLSDKQLHKLEMTQADVTLYCMKIQNHENRSGLSSIATSPAYNYEHKHNTPK